MNPREVWDAAFSQLEIQLDRASFDTWLRDAAFLRFEDGVFVIGVPNSYARDMLTHRLYRNVRRVVSDVYGNQIELEFVLHKPTREREQAANDAPLFRLLAEQEQAVEQETQPLHRQIARPARPELPESELNPRLTFDRFIFNQSNRMAAEAAMAVSDHPARAYNPLFIYGGVGLGKTHLLQAAAHACAQRNSRVIYVPAEAFTNDLVDAIRNRKTAMFRDKYRSLDALLVDDIQFLAGKESTQEEFFHTFNALYTFNKQIIIASDRHPSELKTLADRLRSRFEGGLVIDLQPPEFETRVAIVQMWAREQGVLLERSVCEAIAERAHHNIREMEGLFNQVLVKTRLRGASSEAQGVEWAMNGLERRYEAVTLRQVLEVVSERYNVPAAALSGKQRTQRVNLARQVAMYLAREVTDAPLVQIGAIFGGRSHATVLHSCNRIAELLDDDPVLRQEVSILRNDLLNAAV